MRVGGARRELAARRGRRGEGWRGAAGDGVRRRGEATGAFLIVGQNIKTACGRYARRPFFKYRQTDFTLTNISVFYRQLQISVI